MKLLFNFIVIFLAIIIFSKSTYSQQLTEAQIEASYIYNFAININWPNINEIDTFKIAILGQNKELFDNLNLIKKSKIIHGKPLDVLQSDDLDQILSRHPQIVYVAPDLNPRLHDFYWKLSEYPILIVTDEAQKLIYSMINFYKKEGRVYFILNEQNAKASGLTVNRELLVLGGSQLDIYNVYKEMEHESQLLRQQLAFQQARLDSLSVIIDSQINIIKLQKRDIQERQKQISSLQSQLEKMKEDFIFERRTLDSLRAVISERERYLIAKNEEIAGKQKQIQELKKGIDAQRQIYNDLLKNIELKRQQLVQKEHELNQYQQRVIAQRRSIFALVLLAALFVFIILGIYFTLKTIKEKNRQLEEANRLITNQAEELKVVNYELEKVSLAASKADNVIYILTPYGTIEWVNDAVETKYRFKKHEIIGKKIYEIITLAPEQIIKFLEKCRTEKQPVIFDNYFKKGDGSYIWAQTTLTPVIGPDGQVTRIIALDSDITKIKLATYEIEKKNEELVAQHEILANQKEQIENQNNIIRSSIDYARIIQRSIMPKDEYIRSLAKDYFLIFRPLQTVSGDFYWIVQEEEDHNVFYTAIVDCTGHGVPGAFMSLISERLLDEIIFMKDIKQPSAVLTEMDRMIVDILGNSDEEDTLAGLDMILLRIKRQPDKTFEITFSGAKRPLVYYIPGQKDIEFIKTDRFSIGQDLFKREKIKTFTDYTIEVPENTILYMFTDGITDQYCSFIKKKIGTLRLLDLIREMKDKRLAKQKETLVTYLDYCMKDEEQRDDITFWALQL